MVPRSLTCVDVNITVIRKHVLEHVSIRTILDREKLYQAVQCYVCRLCNYTYRVVAM
jgi:hypothetical protein